MYGRLDCHRTKIMIESIRSDNFAYLCATNDKFQQTIVAVDASHLTFKKRDIFHARGTFLSPILMDSCVFYSYPHNIEDIPVRVVVPYNG